MPKRFRGSMYLGDILSKDQIVIDLRASNRWEAIDELISVLVNTGKIKPEHKDAIAAVVKKRETSMSTGLGFGVTEALDINLAYYHAFENHESGSFRMAA